MKKNRQSIIARLIEEKSIGTQEELLSQLLRMGVNVTQATVSRDIKEMRIVKRPDSAGEYRYCMPVSSNEEHTQKYMNILLGSVVYTDIAMNTVVVKCHTGTAQGAAAALDYLELENTAGTLAGDDTIFILCYTEKAAEEVKTKLDELFGF